MGKLNQLPMDIEHIAAIRDKIISYLKKRVNSQEAIKNVWACYNLIVKYGHGSEIRNYEEFYTKVIVPTHSPSRSKNLKIILGKYWHVDKYGEMPAPGSHSRFLEENRYEALSAEFKTVVDIYCSTKLARGCKEESVLLGKQTVQNFLFFCMGQHLESVTEISESVISQYFTEKGIHTFKSTPKILIDAFRYSTSQIEGCGTVVSYLPKIRTTIRPYEALSVNESNKIKAIIDSLDDDFLLRDKAIIKTVYYLGVRGCDVVNLTISDLDFNESSISFIQSKTQVRLTLPLRPVVGNAIVDYLLHERPDCDIDNVFVLHDPRQIRPINTKTVYWALRKVFDKAQVRTKNGRKGIHIFRHNLAMRLIHEGCDSIEVTSVLGHTSPEALNAYLSADEQSLQKCALSIEKYPVNLDMYK